MRVEFPPRLVDGSIEVHYILPLVGVLLLPGVLLQVYQSPRQEFIISFSLQEFYSSHQSCPSLNRRSFHNPFKFHQVTGCPNKNKITDEFLYISWYFYTISLGHPVYILLGTSIPYVWDTLYIPDLVLLYNVNGTPCIYLTWYFYSMCMGHPVYT